MLSKIKNLTQWLSKTGFLSSFLGLLFFAFAYLSQDAIFAGIAVLFLAIASIDVLANLFFR